ncbi:hypothetical protein H2200_004828 [Cladophialophora chaetospira]|uniref:Uncharacterized protein n=1 Tax=Cladophialophora chaetospira TaxID=386627 RepID=A0AA39CKU0_9EURO|nr:hypothetical protein H2200_004828 [Cladophialophora chaetospira]
MFKFNQITKQLLFGQHSQTPGMAPSRSPGATDVEPHPSEARAFNCTLGIMNYGFLGSECYYEDMADKALAEGPWKWYLDRNGTMLRSDLYATRDAGSQGRSSEGREDSLGKQDQVT